MTEPKDQKKFSIADYINSTAPIFSSPDEIRQDAETLNEDVAPYIASMTPERRAQLERMAQTKQDMYDEMLRREAERN
jgi:hypothetical protein